MRSLPDHSTDPAPAGPAEPAAISLALDAPQAAAALGIGTRTLWALTRAGRVPHVRIGRRVLYPVHLLQQWLAEQAAAAGNGRIA